MQIITTFIIVSFKGDFDNRLVIYLTFGLILSFFVFVH